MTTHTSPLARQEILSDSHGTCYLLGGAFDPQECAAWIEATEARGYEATAGDYPASYRDNDRLMFDDPALAETLFERMRDHLPHELVRGGERWRLVRLNERFRCCRYRGGQGFSIHRDGPYAPEPGVRSWLTFMLYLNNAESFSGGATRFFDDRQGASTLASIRPEQGTVIVFGHDLWHDGQPVPSGTKYVLRSDVLYERIAPAADLPCSSAAPGALATLRGHQGYVWSVLALTDGRLASAARDGTTRVWTPGDSGTWREAQRLGGPWRSVTALAEPRPGVLWTAHRDGQLVVWRAEPSGRFQPGRPLAAAHSAGAILSMIRVEPDRVALSDSLGFVTLRDHEGAVLSRHKAHAAWVWALAKQARGSGWFSGSDDGTLRRWSKAGRPEDSLDLRAPIRALAALPDGGVAVGTARGEVLLVREG
ncbi:MAG: 2OG-Fe(II) oxygenase, partial [Planctomycetes bacterium]|nr:2OG-Fe(II) oxygenase [Planctomycetota bacterium]